MGKKKNKIILTPTFDNEAKIKIADTDYFVVGIEELLAVVTAQK